MLLFIFSIFAIHCFSSLLLIKLGDVFVFWKSRCTRLFSRIIARRLKLPFSFALFMRVNRLIIRENTFIVGAPSQIKNSKESKNSSPTYFKASKTPNFKKLHEREQARMESIVDHASRKRERYLHQSCSI